MNKRVGILSLILAAGFALFSPVMASAQDRGYRDRDYRSQGYNDRSFRDNRRDIRRDDRIYRAEERRDFRGRDWRAPAYVGRPYVYGYSAPRYDRYCPPPRPYGWR